MNDDDKDEVLSADEVTRYRRIAPRTNFCAQDRLDIAYATKEATRRMTAPTTDEHNKLVRLGRYLARYPRVVNWYKYQNDSEKVVACTDSDWAGCRRTRRSTSSELHPQRVAHAEVLEQDTSSSGVEFGRSRTKFSSVYTHSPVARTFVCAQRAHCILQKSSCVSHTRMAQGC